MLLFDSIKRNKEGRNFPLPQGINRKDTKSYCTKKKKNIRKIHFKKLKNCWLNLVYHYENYVSFDIKQFSIVLL